VRKTWGRGDWGRKLLEAWRRVDWEGDKKWKREDEKILEVLNRGPRKVLFGRR
jgi:hypothetical protein